MRMKIKSPIAVVTVNHLESCISIIRHVLEFCEYEYGMEAKKKDMMMNKMEMKKKSQSIEEVEISSFIYST